MNDALDRQLQLINYTSDTLINEAHYPIEELNPV